MKRFLSLFSLLLILNVSFSFAQDTIRVFAHQKETIVTDPSQGVRSFKSWAKLPAPNIPIRKITMYVHFACPDSMRCADWDYSDRILLERVNGVNGSNKNWELGRVITPYGGFFAKDWHFTWEQDVTDFSLILRDSCEINYIHSGYEPNDDRGWLLSIEFEIITGTPTAKPISITQIYNDHFEYGNSANPIEKQMVPVSFMGDPKCAYAQLRVIQTGHGMDRPDNCGEFCSKYREIILNNQLINKRQMWKKCGDNPLSPQAGTWIYDRANWCPGDLVDIETFDLKINPNQQNQLHFIMEPYTAEVINSGAQVISAYVIQYEQPAKSYDVSVDDIIVPSDKDIYSHYNPASMNPMIIIKNNGKEPVTEMTIQYGTKGYPSKTFLWKGFLKFNEETTVTLPGEIDMNQDKNLFMVTLSKPNNKKDEYQFDNKMTSSFSSCPIHYSPIVFSLLTNNEPQHNAWRLVDQNGKVLYERKLGTLSPQITYFDSLYLSNGSYSLQFRDTTGDGLEFWYNTKGGRGEARLYNEEDKLIKSFDPDCGSGWNYQFKIGANPDPIDQNLKSMAMYPARTNDKTTFSYFSNTKEDITVQIISDPGNQVLEKHFYPMLKEGFFTYTLTNYPYGRFYLVVSTNQKEIYKRRIRFMEPEKEEFPYEWPSDSLVKLNLEKWQDWKFGVIIHWGAYSQWSVVESWSLCPEDEDWCKRRGPYADNYYKYVEEYEKIRTVFNPLQFNPEKWAKACKNAGMKYVVFTTKHHDGFCMYDTKYTDYKITDKGSLFSTNPRSNVVKEVFNAFRAENMAIGAYFSKPDWHSDDYWWRYFPPFDRNVNYDPKKYPEKWTNFQNYTYNQIEELMTGYGKIDILWLDGGWVRPEGTLTEETKPWIGKNQWIQDINMPRIAKMARINQPGILVVDRTVHGEYENYRTPEQSIPVIKPDYPWESCITLGDSWYAIPNETYKSYTWSIHTLVKIVAKGGNFLMGIGPDKTGDLVPEVYKRLEEIGNWMHINGEAIYDTKPLIPYEQDKYCFTQSKDEKVKYLFYLLLETEVIPDRIVIPSHFKTASTIQILGFDQPLPVIQKDGLTYIEIPKDLKIKLKGTPALVVKTL
ncbi:MAG: Peptide-N-glycosidase terminal/Peptide-N-glycosidase terminal [Bacteroidetes bacterium]|nr:Peptide-N-glycosidase terminal/Peptide-N-glycosidase terminal [Bacteroidota bacterium]